MPDYSKMKFSFQGHMNKKKTRSFKHSFILAIATEFYEKDENYIEFYENSIPDAWMYDDEKGLCFLIESKVGQNPLDKMQLNSHAHEWLGLDEQEEINKRILSIKWFDLLTAIEQLHVLSNKGELAMNQQELLIIQSLIEYLGFYLKIQQSISFYSFFYFLDRNFHKNHQHEVHPLNYHNQVL